jgi:predicted HicB family RNase H-like nuclease
VTPLFVPANANKEYSRRFVLRVGKKLHRELAIKAMRSGESLNNFCQKVLKKAVGHS